MSTRALRPRDGHSIIVLDKFIQATRDSGYKGTSSAISELVDNALQAGAKTISILVRDAEGPGQDGLDVLIMDDGRGMDAETIRHALRFGGSTRFNDREGLGRYGMGLPNSSLSQACRVTVYSWQDSGKVYSSYLDVDEIAAGAMAEVPESRISEPPIALPSSSGTLVAWTKCDRLDQRRISTLEKKLATSLGRRFRYFIWKGVAIKINGTSIEAVDPLYLNPKSKFTGAKVYGEPLEYKISSDPSNPKAVTGRVRVTFSELPVHEWHGLSNEEKQSRGVSKGAGVSLVRAGREVDYGWFFLPGKRRENYDDWWRCEIQFEASLDEAFGITHTKQQIRPKAFLLEALAPDMEAAARALNVRARKAHTAAKVSEQRSPSEQIAQAKDRMLPRLPKKANGSNEILGWVKNQHPALFSEEGPVDKTDYKIIEGRAKHTAFFDIAYEAGKLILVLDPHHPFYKKVYRPAADGVSSRDREMKTQLELMLLAAARAEVMAKTPAVADKMREFRLAWSNALATFFSE